MVEQVETLTVTDSPRAEFFRHISRGRMEMFQQFLGIQTFFTPDGLAMALALETDIVRKAEAHHVQVELAGQHMRGHTAVDWFDRTGQEPNVNLVVELDVGRFWELMQAAVRWRPAEASSAVSPAMPDRLLK